MPVDTPHPEYDKFSPIWKKVRDVIEGEVAVTSMDNLPIYLPPPPGMNPKNLALADMKEGQIESRYSFYASFADFPEITGPMVEGIMGLIHEKPPEVNLPDKLSYLLKEATPDGESLTELWQHVTREVFYTGRISLLGDLRGGEDNQGARVRLCAYSNETMINWRLLRKSEGAGAQMVVLMEHQMVEDPEDPFEHEILKLYRELRLSPDGKYWSRMWLAEDEKEPVVVSQEGADANGWIQPALRGKAFSEIPLTVINATDVGYEYGPVPAWPLAKRALAIFRKSADVNRSLFIKGDPQPYILGIQEDMIPEEIGGGAIWGFPDAEGKVGYLDIDGQGIPLQMKAIEGEYSKFYGEAGHLLESQSKGAEAAEALRIRQSMKQVSVKAMVQTTGDGMQEALRMLGRMTGMSEQEVESITFSPNVNFTEGHMSGQELLYMMQSKAQGAPLSNQTVHALMRKRQMTDMPFEEEKALSEADTLSTLGLLGREEGSDEPSTDEPSS